MEAAGPLHCDVAIAGGGMIGLSLAAALAPLPLSVAVIEPVPEAAALEPGFDARTTALSAGSRRILDGIGIWPALAPAATPIRRIHVSDRGAFAFARLTAEEQGVPALGYSVENSRLIAALRAACAPGGRLHWCATRVAAAEAGEDAVTLATADGGRVVARLAVAADGAGSPLRRALGIDASVSDYGQQAIVANVETSRFHDYIAYERFTPDGPIALLPAAEGRCALVWTLSPEAAARVLALDDAEFLATLQQAFGHRLGRFTRIGRRQAWPLALTRSERQTGPRGVVIGNAAQGLHPIAGQGFNLGLRDVATLAELLADQVAASGAGADPGDAALLARYADWRQPDRRAVIRFTDGLVRLFGQRLSPLRAARASGLLLFDLLRPAKREFARITMGLAGRQPRLVRGLPLLPPERPAP